MAENKASALKDANYKVKLILGASPKEKGRLIDITEPVVEALSDRDLFASDGDFGIAYKIVGLLETSVSPNYTASTPLRTHRDGIFLLQDVERILDASIVNAKQLEAVKDLMRTAFRKREDDAMAGIDYLLQDSTDLL